MVVSGELPASITGAEREKPEHDGSRYLRKYMTS
jgi:hypothetical protein